MLLGFIKYIKLGGLALLFFWFIGQPAYADNSKIDSLQALSQGATSDSALVDVYTQIGWAYLNKNLDSQRYYAEKVLNLIQELPTNTYAKAEAITLLAGVDYNHGEYEGALSRSMEAMHLFRDLGDSVKLCRAYNHLTILYESLDDFEKGLYYSELALALKAPRGDSVSWSSSLHQSARLHIKTKDYNTALWQLGKAEQLLSLVGHTRKLADVYTTFSELYLLLGNNARTKSYIDKAMEGYSDADYPYGTMATLILEGKYYLRKEQYYDAQASLEEAYQLATLVQDLKSALTVQELLRFTHKEQGNYAAALQHDSIHDQLNDSLFSVERSRAIARMQSTFDWERQQLENERLLAQQKAQEEGFRRSKMMNNAMGWVLALVLAGGLGLWFIFRRVRNLNLIMKVQRQEILNRNEQLKEVVAEVNQQNDQIQSQNDALRGINAYKDKLFSLISHDFRSPLASVLSLLAVIENGQMTLDESRKFAKKVGLRVQHTFQLVSNLLYWSKSQMNGISPNPTVFDIEDVLQEVNGVYLPIAESKWVDLQIDLSGHHLVLADRDMVHTVLRNLISNAIKYTPGQGQVAVQVQSGVEGITIAIRDNGLGMDKGTLEKLFGDHVVSQLGTQNEKGTGIGLSLSKGFVDMNKGKIWVESALNQGSTFFVYFPSPTNEKVEQKVQELAETAELVET